MPPAGQLLPAVAEAMVLVSVLFPVSGFATVTENVTVATAPGREVPVQVSTGLANDHRPRRRRSVAVISDIIQHARQRIGDGGPGKDVRPVFVTVIV